MSSDPIPCFFDIIVRRTDKDLPEEFNFHKKDSMSVAPSIGQSLQVPGISIPLIVGNSEWLPCMERHVIQLGVGLAPDVDAYPVDIVEIRKMQAAGFELADVWPDHYAE